MVYCFSSAIPWVYVVFLDNEYKPKMTKLLANIFCWFNHILDCNFFLPSVVLYLSLDFLLLKGLNLFVPFAKDHAHDFFFFPLIKNVHKHKCILSWSKMKFSQKLIASLLQQIMWRNILFGFLYEISSKLNLTSSYLILSKFSEN